MEKFTPKKNCNQKKLDRESNPLSDTVEFFWLRFFSGVNFYIKIPTRKFYKGHSTVKRCIQIAQYNYVYIYRGVHGGYSSLKVDKSIVGTSPRYRFMVTMEPGTRQMKFFDTKLQMFENLNFVQKITNSQMKRQIHFRESVGIITEGKKPGR
jgi:hypothetical protein